MLINLRNALMAGKRLPYDAEVEYLESTGTQWIATTTIDDPANNIAQVTFSIPTSTSASMFLFGSSGVRFNFCAARWGSNRYNFGPTGATTPALPISLGEVHTGTYTLDNGQLTYTLDGDSATYASSLVYNNLPFGLFTIYNLSVNKFIGRIYNFKVIRKSDGAVLADFIPVRKGTVGYLYDRVTGRLFGNAGTGDFVLGQDVVPVEYIESHGTEWIDTGVYGDLDTAAEFRAAATANDALYPVFGARISYYQKALAVYNGSDVGYKYTASYDNIRPGNLSLVSDVSADVGAWVDFHIGKSMSMGSWQKDTTSYASRFTTEHTLCLFAWNQNGTITCGKYRVSYLKIWQNGVLVRDYIPVRVGTGSTWEGAMMDVLTRRIYRNAGTGAFTYGNDLKYPIPSE